MIKGFIIAFALFIFLLGFGWFISNSVSNELESQDNLDQNTIDAINNLRDNYGVVNLNLIVVGCVAFVFAILVIIVTKGYKFEILSEDNYSDITGEDIFPIAFKENERIKEDAVTILKRRYAKGEIDSFEYTEKMSRL